MIGSPNIKKTLLKGLLLASSMNYIILEKFMKVSFIRISFYLLPSANSHVIDIINHLLSRYPKRRTIAIE